MAALVQKCGCEGEIKGWKGRLIKEYKNWWVNWGTINFISNAAMITYEFSHKKSEKVFVNYLFLSYNYWKVKLFDFITFYFYLFTIVHVDERVKRRRKCCFEKSILKNLNIVYFWFDAFTSAKDNFSKVYFDLKINFTKIVKLF